MGEKLVWVSIDSFLFRDTGWKLGGWQSILESPLEVIKSIVQPKKRGSLAGPGRHGPLPMLCCPIIRKEWHSGTFSPSLWCLILPRSFLFHNTGAKGRQFFFLIFLHCPCCSSKEHKRPLQGTASATTNNNKKCGKLEGFKDTTTACHPLSTALGVRE